MENADVVTGQLVLVATPLGNLGDISRRALSLLETADVIYCEDTRRSSTLFSAHGIAVNGRLRALHEHNEASMCDQIVAQVAGGWTVVVISDAGTPGISDPGARVVAAVAAAGLRVTTAPGPSAVIAALTIVTILTVQGLAYLLPTNLRVYFELRRPNPDGPKIGALMSRYFYVVAIQGTLQVLIIVIMARFATGL